VGLGKEAAVQEAHRLQLQPAPALRAALLVAREQLLGHGVAVVVRQHVDAADAQPLQQRLVEVRLVRHRVRVGPGLGREAEADHVRRHPGGEACGQAVPHPVPVPGGGGEAVDEQQAGAAAGPALAAIEDAMAAVVEGLAGPAPGIERGAQRVA
jgi:hypothetical protein